MADIIHSWKGIATYLEKDVRTCSRWARDLGLPVHHVNGDSSRSKVFAYREEIDEWLRSRPAGGSTAEPRPRATIRRFLIPALAVGGTLAAFFAGWLLLRGPRQALATGPSIAVAPFENLSPAAPDEYLAEGITTEVANGLASYGSIRLIPASAVPDFSKRGQDPELIRTELGADYLLKGALRKTGEAVQMRFEIIRIRDTVRVLNLEFDETLDRIPFVIDSLRAKISEVLDIPSPAGLVLPGSRPAATALDDVLKGRYLLKRLSAGTKDDPWALYHQGRFYSHRSSRETNEIAISLFGEAIEADPKFAPAYLGLADCYLNFINMGWDEKKLWMDKADALIQNALALSPDDPECQAMRIYALLFRNAVYDDPTTEEGFALAETWLAKYPQHLRLNKIAGQAFFMRFGKLGRAEDYARALACEEKAFWMDMYSIRNIAYANMLQLNHEFDRAMAVCEAVRTVDVENMALYAISDIHYCRGDLDRSQAILESLPASVQERAYILLRLAIIAARRGRADEAAKYLEKRALIIPGIRAPAHFRDEINLASIEIGLGRRAKGLALLRSFFSRGDLGAFRYIYRRYVDIDPNFDAVRETTEFKAAVQGGSSS